MTNTKLLFQIRDKLAATLHVAAASAETLVGEMVAEASIAPARFAGAAEVVPAAAGVLPASAVVAAVPAFDPSNFTEAELRILYQSQLLGSEFCSEEFTRGAIEYLRENQAKFEREILIHDVDRGRVLQAIIPFDSLWKGEAPGNSFIREQTFQILEYIRSKVCAEHKKEILDLTKFLALGLNLIPREYPIKILYPLTFLTGDLRIIEFILNLTPTEDKDFFELFEDGIGSTLWGFDLSKFESMMTLTQEKKEFFANILREATDLKIIAFILEYLSDERIDSIIETEVKSSTSALAAEASAASAAAAAGSGSESLTSWQKVEQALESEFPNALREEIDRKLAGKLDVAKFKSLAKKYRMPTNVVRKLLDGSDAIFLTKSNSDKKIAEYFPELTRQSEYVYKFPKKFFDRDKTTELVLHSYDDPTALFVGKMTKSCQFFTGHSSDQAVIPVYSKPGCSLVSVRRTGGDKKILASMFAWLGAVDSKIAVPHSSKTDSILEEMWARRSRHSKREVDIKTMGLVLDSIELAGEERVEFVPNLLREFSQILRGRGLKLWVGSGGQTPELYVPDALASSASGSSLQETLRTKLKTIDSRPQRIDQDLLICADSIELYEIDPTQTYISERKQELGFKTIRSKIDEILKMEGFTFEEKRSIVSFEGFREFSNELLKLALSKAIRLDLLLQICSQFTASFFIFMDNFMEGYHPVMRKDKCEKFIFLCLKKGVDFEAVLELINLVPKKLLLGYDESSADKLYSIILKKDIDPNFVKAILKIGNLDFGLYMLRFAEANGYDLSNIAQRITELNIKLFDRFGNNYMKGIVLGDFDIKLINAIFEQLEEKDQLDSFSDIIYLFYHNGRDLREALERITELPKKTIQYFDHQTFAILLILPIEIRLFNQLYDKILRAPPGITSLILEVYNKKDGFSVFIDNFLRLPEDLFRVDFDILLHFRKQRMDFEIFRKIYYKFESEYCFYMECGNQIMRHALEEGVDLEVLASRIQDIPNSSFFLKDYGVLTYLKINGLLRYITSDDFNVEDAVMDLTANPGHISRYLFYQGMLNEFYSIGKDGTIIRETDESLGVVLSDAVPSESSAAAAPSASTSTAAAAASAAASGDLSDSQEVAALGVESYAH